MKPAIGAVYLCGCGDLIGRKTNYGPLKQRCQRCDKTQQLSHLRNWLNKNPHYARDWSRDKRKEIKEDRHRHSTQT